MRYSRDIVMIGARVRMPHRLKKYYTPTKGISVDFGPNDDNHVCDIFLRASPYAVNPEERKNQEDLEKELEKFTVVSDKPLNDNGQMHFNKEFTLLDNPMLNEIDKVRSNPLDVHPVFVPYDTHNRMKRQIEDLRKRNLISGNIGVKAEEVYRDKTDGTKYVKMPFGQVSGKENEINQDYYAKGYTQSQHELEDPEKKKRLELL